MLVLLGYLSLGIWLYLFFGRGMHWAAAERDDVQDFPEPAHWPSVAAIVPARNEADVIACSISSLLEQDYPGTLDIILVDDESDDGTAAIAGVLPNGERLTIIEPGPRPSGWTGKLWAVSRGVTHATETFTPEFLWLTDADIAHTPDNLRHLVARAQSGSFVLASLMARLQCQNLSEYFYIPAFVYFFQMLYPFSRVNDPKSKIAAAAGGCMLIERIALQHAGGIAAIRDAIIDDCAMGRLMKAEGPIWLGLTERSISIRPYKNIGEIRRMVARSAYAQLGYSPLILAGTLMALMIVFVTPPLVAVFGFGLIRIAAIFAWCLMTVSFWPMLRFYNRSLFWGFLLPAIGLVYAAFTFDSALQHWRGRGGMWKGRAQAMVKS